MANTINLSNASFQISGGFASLDVTSSAILPTTTIIVEQGEETGSCTVEAPTQPTSAPVEKNALKPKFTSTSVTALMNRSDDKIDLAAWLLGVLFREAERYNGLEAQGVAAAILDALGRDAQGRKARAALLAGSSDPARRIREMTALLRGHKAQARLLAAAGDTISELIHDADWPFGEASRILKVLLEDGEGKNPFVEGDKLAKPACVALTERIKTAVTEAPSADAAMEKANTAFYCLQQNPVFMGFADDAAAATHDLLLSRLIALGATESDANAAADNCRDNPTDPRLPKPKPVSKEELSAFLKTVTGAIADAEQVDEEAKTHREMAERGNPCRTLADLKVEKAKAKPAKESVRLEKPLDDEERVKTERAFAEAKKAEAKAKDAVRYENALPENEKSKEHYHRFVEELQAAKTERLRLQAMLEADARLRKEEELKAEHTKREAAAAKPKDDKKSKDLARHQRPERERHAHA